ncbi:MAG: hypothetical protein WCP86_06390 [bacterium]
MTCFLEETILADCITNYPDDANGAIQHDLFRISVISVVRGGYLVFHHRTKCLRDK